MYVASSLLHGPECSRDLNQGDIVANLLLPRPLTDKSFCVRQGPKIKFPAEPSDLAPAHKDLRVMSQLIIEPFCLVLSNSCDNSGGEPLLVCPVRPFKFRDGLSDAERWRNISVAATGAATPKVFYMPACDPVGLPRSSASILELVSLSHDYFIRCVLEGGAQRVRSLSLEAVRHLQRSLDLFFARNAREDHEWPSRDDLLLKIEWLKVEIGRGTARQHEYRAELQVLQAKLAVGSDDHVATDIDGESRTQV